MVLHIYSYYQEKQINHNLKYGYSNKQQTICIAKTEQNKANIQTLFILVRGQCSIQWICILVICQQKENVAYKDRTKIYDDMMPFDVRL